MVKQLVDERRQGVRAKRIMSIQYRPVKRSANQPWNLSTTQDMSFVGLSFLSDTPYTPGDKLEIKVIMSGVLDIFNGTAEVVRIEKKKTGAFYLIGLRFLLSASRPRKAKSYAAKSKVTPKNRIKRALKKK